MNRLSNHLEEVGETYPQHLIKAAGFAATMLTGGFACLVHALFPFLFVRTGSDCIRRLHRVMVENRKQASNAEQQDQRTAGDNQPLIVHGG